MKASEVTESGFYWWKAPSTGMGWFTDERMSGWNPIYVQVQDGEVLGWVIGSEYLCVDGDLEGNVIGPLSPPIEGEGNEA